MHVSECLLYLFSYCVKNTPVYAPDVGGLAALAPLDVLVLCEKRANKKY